MAILSERSIFKAAVFDVREATIQEPGATKAIRHFVAHPGSAVVLPMESDGSVLLVSQFRARKAKDQETFLEALGIDPAKTGVERTKQFRAWLMR